LISVQEVVFILVCRGTVLIRLLTVQCTQYKQY
jgi:hypothetical protein